MEYKRRISAAEVLDSVGHHRNSRHIYRNGARMTTMEQASKAGVAALPRALDLKSSSRWCRAACPPAPTAGPFLEETS